MANIDVLTLAFIIVVCFAERLERVEVRRESKHRHRRYRVIRLKHLVHR